MRVFVQRCISAYVEVDKNVVGKIGSGLMLLVGFTHNDTSKEIDYMVDKIINLRIFDDEEGVMNKSLSDVGGSILSVSQFTLYADTSRGRRPSYSSALAGSSAKILYEEFNNKLRLHNIKVETGIFGAEMEVSLINDGPVSMMISKERVSNE